jgi:hypothetical protein
VAQWVRDWIARYNGVNDPELNPCGYKLIRKVYDVEKGEWADELVEALGL